MVVYKSEDSYNNEADLNMKRLSNLFDKIISVENLIKADEKARKGKIKSYGVKIHDKHKIENIQKLHEMLSNGTFHTSKYSVFKVYEPKEREIYRLPYYPDRIVHHAIMNVLEPIWVNIFTADTCSCIKKRGIMEAHRRMLKYLKDQNGTKYCLKTDIHKFYPSIDHDCLKIIIRKKIKDVRLLSLLDEIIDSADGVPIGNYLSQYFANLYLAYIDHQIKERLSVKYYIRYADDMVFLSSTKEELANILKELKVMLSELKLKLKGNEQIFPVGESRKDNHKRGIDFVGFIFYHKQTLIRKSIKKSFARKCSSLNKKKISNKEYKQNISPWLGWTKYSNSHNLKHKLLPFF